MQTNVEAYVEGYIQGRIGQKSAATNAMVPQEGKELEWILFELLLEMKKLNAKLR